MNGRHNRGAPCHLATFSCSACPSALLRMTPWIARKELGGPFLECRIADVGVVTAWT